MGNFDIKPSKTGIGPTTLKIKPLSLNETDTPIVEVIAIKVGQSQKTVTLTQEGKVPIIETWESTFMIGPPTQANPFKGETSGEVQAFTVLSFETKYLDGVAQEVYNQLPWSVEIEDDTWLEYLKSEGLEGKDAGALGLKTLSKNDTEVIRTTTVTLKQVEKTLELQISQSAGRVTYEYVGQTRILINHPLTNDVGNGSIQNMNFTKNKLINGVFLEQVGKNIPFKIPGLSTILEGSFPAPPGETGIPWKFEAYNFGTLDKEYLPSGNISFKYTSKMHILPGTPVMFLQYDIFLEEGSVLSLSFEFQR